MTDRPTDSPHHSLSTMSPSTERSAQDTSFIYYSPCAIEQLHRSPDSIHLPHVFFPLHLLPSPERPCHAAAASIHAGSCLAARSTHYAFYSKAVFSSTLAASFNPHTTFQGDQRGSAEPESKGMNGRSAGGQRAWRGGAQIGGAST